MVVCRRLKLGAARLPAGRHPDRSAGAGLLIDNSKDANALAEFGVVFLMFSIGLRFSLLPKLKVLQGGIRAGHGTRWQPSCLRCQPHFGSLAVSWPTLRWWRIGDVVSGLIVSTLLNERAELEYSAWPANSLAFCCFQDLAVVPLLIVIPALASGNGDVWLQLVQADEAACWRFCFISTSDCCARAAYGGAGALQRAVYHQRSADLAVDCPISPSTPGRLPWAPFSPTC